MKMSQSNFLGHVTNGCSQTVVLFQLFQLVKMRMNHDLFVLYFLLEIA